MQTFSLVHGIELTAADTPDGARRFVGEAWVGAPGQVVEAELAPAELESDAQVVGLAAKFVPEGAVSAGDEGLVHRLARGPIASAIADVGVGAGDGVGTDGKISSHCCGLAEEAEGEKQDHLQEGEKAVAFHRDNLQLRAETSSRNKNGLERRRE